MIDIKLLREQLDLVRAAIANKKFNTDIDVFLELDATRCAKITEAEQVSAKQKVLNQEMVVLKKGYYELLEKVREMKMIAGKAKELEIVSKEADERFQETFLSIPNSLCC